jgi:hypothetical protein
MALKDYSENESLERIYNVLIGTNHIDNEDFLGQMPKNEALTRIAQILEGSLGDAVFAPVETIENGIDMGSTIIH